MIKYDNDFHFCHWLFLFLTATCASGLKNDYLILGILKCNGIAVKTHFKKQMFVDSKGFKNTSNINFQNNVIYTHEEIRFNMSPGSACHKTSAQNYYPVTSAGRAGEVSAPDLSQLRL